MSDASFHDADQGPLMLRAEAPEDVAVLSMLVQDAVLTGADVTFDRKRRQLAMLINRFRWDDVEDAQREGRPFERVRALLVVSDITGIRSDGIDRGDDDEVLSLLAAASAEHGQSIAMVTHDPVAASHADRVLFLGDGHIIADKPRQSAEQISAFMLAAEVAA